MFVTNWKLHRAVVGYPIRLSRVAAASDENDDASREWSDSGPAAGEISAPLIDDFHIINAVPGQDRVLSGNSLTTLGPLRVTVAIELGKQSQS